jgi:hypothetical protein
MGPKWITGAKAVTTGERDEFRREALKMVKAGAKAFAEMAALHVSLQPRHVFEQTSPDHPLFTERLSAASSLECLQHLKRF